MKRLIFLTILTTNLTGCYLFHPLQEEAFERMEAIYAQSEPLFTAFSEEFDDKAVSDEESKFISLQDGYFDHPALKTLSARALIDALEPKRISVARRDERVYIFFSLYSWGGAIGGSEWGFSFAKPLSTNFDNNVELDDFGYRDVANFSSCSKAKEEVSKEYIRHVTCKLQSNWVAQYFGD